MNQSPHRSDAPQSSPPDPQKLLLSHASMLDVVQQAVIAADTDGRIVYMNRFAQQLYGYRPSDWPDLTVQDFFVAGSDQEEAATIMAAMAQGQSWEGEMVVRGREGTPFLAMVLGSVVYDEGGVVVGFVGISTDLTDIRHTEAALRESNELFRLIAEYSTELVALLDADGCYTYVNPSHERLLGYSPPTRLIGRSIFTIIHPDDQIAMRAQWARLTTHGMAQATVRIAHADGSWRWIEASGGEILRDSQTYSVVIAHDVTARLLIEEHAKMGALEKFAGGIAHDLNNLSMVIDCAARIGLKSTDDPAPREEFNAILEAIEHIINLAQQLGTVARQQIILPTPLILNNLIEEIAGVLRSTIGEPIEIDLHLAPDLRLACVDRTQMTRLILNLALNARDAMPHGGTLTLSTANTDLDEREAQRRVGILPGSYVRLTVRDTGEGIRPELFSRIFDPFFTTKAPGKGTGMGLAICYAIVKQHRGTIEVESEVGRGTAVQVLLPCSHDSDEPERPVVHPIVHVEGHAGTRTILLAEDTDLLRRVVSEALRSQGHTVLEASNGLEALRVAESYEGTIHLLLTDIVMPHMNGVVLARQLVALRPALHVVYMSGYAEPTYEPGVPGAHFLAKPISLAALTHLVGDVLGNVTR